MRWSRNDIMRSLSELAGLSDEECQRLNRTLEKASWRLKWIPSVAGFATWWGWMLLFGKGSDFLENYPKWDLLGYLHRLGWIGILIMLALGFGVATFLALGVGFPLWRRLLRRAITVQLQSRYCLWCGYCLQGLEVSKGRVRCPECGNHSPVRM